MYIRIRHKIDDSTVVGKGGGIPPSIGRCFNEGSAAQGGEWYRDYGIITRETIQALPGSPCLPGQTGCSATGINSKSCFDRNGTAGIGGALDQRMVFPFLPVQKMMTMQPIRAYVFSSLAQLLFEISPVNMPAIAHCLCKKVAVMWLVITPDYGIAGTALVLRII